MDCLLLCIIHGMEKCNLFLVYALLQTLLINCNYSFEKKINANDFLNSTPVSFPKNIGEIPAPVGFERKPQEDNSFAKFLNSIELKENKTVYLYNGQPKLNQSAQYAVLEISLPNKDLQQCADAVMRLRAEYLFAQKLFDQIVFYDYDKNPYKFSAPFTREHFKTYLNRVFGMCGSASLSKQLKPVADFADVQPGDVIIRGGFPGHAVIVMDVAVNPSGEKIYMLAQSYMPAQDIHVLKNPADDKISPWYWVNDDNFIVTPEYTFTKIELKRW